MMIYIAEYKIVGYREGVKVICQEFSYHEFKAKNDIEASKDAEKYLPESKTLSKILKINLEHLFEKRLIDFREFI
jgi:hypothetical protein